MTDADKSEFASTCEIAYFKEDAFAPFSALNALRCEHFEGKGPGFSILEFGGALAGEVGELCNVLKKIRRLELGVEMVQDDKALLHKKAEEEIADVFMYLDLIAGELGVDLVSAIARKFNDTSYKNNAPYLIGVMRRTPIEE